MCKCVFWICVGVCMYFIYIFLFIYLSLFVFTFIFYDIFIIMRRDVSKYKKFCIFLNFLQDFHSWPSIYNNKFCKKYTYIFYIYKQHVPKDKVGLSTLCHPNCNLNWKGLVGEEKISFSLTKVKVSRIYIIYRLIFNPFFAKK